MSRRDRILVTVTFVAYVAVVALGVVVHEPWWDEAQSWLLARDAPIGELLTHDLAYEGHPPLWYLILAIPARLHLPYRSIDVVSALIGIVGVILLLRLRRVPIAARVLLPFTFYCAYQYTIVSRSYVLIPPLLFAVLAIYEARDRKVIPFALLLVGLSEVSLYGVALAGGLVLLFVIDLWRGRLHLTVPRWKVILAGALVMIHTVVLAVLLRLPSDLSSRASVDLTFNISRMVQIAWSALTRNLIVKADEPSVVVVAFVMTIALALWLWRRGVITEFVVLFASLLPIAGIYFSPWHEGIFFWTMAFVLLLALSRPMPRHRIDFAAYVVLMIALASHYSWTFRSLSYDVHENFTGSRDAARYIAEHGIDRTKVFGAGGRCVELQPYFSHNLFANYHAGRSPAFWDFSTRNEWPGADPERMRTWMTAQFRARPDFFVISTGASSDATYRWIMKRNPDYRLLRVFRGALYWKDEVFQPLDFELYQRVH
jgi:hypothetical protein